jgi:hypothetical protein
VRNKNISKEHFDILRAYLCESKSHRWIQENIMELDAPTRGGYAAMNVLHSYDVRNDQKGLLTGYYLTPKNILTLVNELNQISDEINTSGITYIEGAVTIKSVNAYERNPEARKCCIAYYGAICVACNFDFEKTYGKAGQGYIQVHHLLPLATLPTGYAINPVKDLVTLCANCHAVAHRKQPPYTVIEIKTMINRS